MDGYIDQDEMRIYGEHAARQLRALVLGKTPELDTAVTFVADHLDEATANVAAASTRARAARGEQREATRTKGPLLTEARQFLGRFAKQASVDDEVDRRRFFPRDGTLKGERQSAVATLDLVTRIATELSGPEPRFPDAARWQSEAAQLRDELSPALANSQGASSERRSATPELTAAMASWELTYNAAKNIATAALTLAGHGELLREVFYDLQVPKNAKVTAVPKT